MPDLQNKIKDVHERMFNAAKKAKRSVDEVALLVATKTQPIPLIEKLYALGLRRFGENYLSEALDKIPYLAKDIEWHFIGPIQSNKTRQIAGNFSWVHTIDREKIVERLSAQRPGNLQPLQCLIQVNISDEVQKAGVSIGDIQPLAELIEQAPNLNLRGLMAMPKVMQSEEALSEDFAKMHQLSHMLQQDFPAANQLSMGMSADFELAIQYGATFIRLGSTVVGPRRDHL